MVSKTHNHNLDSHFPTIQGFTLIELMVSVVVLFVLLGFIITYLNPRENLQRSRDQKRMADLQLLEGAIAQYASVHNSYPDLADATRYSTVLPVGSGSSLQSATGGWIMADLSAYIPRMPTDPTNDAAYFYSYRHDLTSYELDAVMELPAEQAQTDGGNNDAVYELGNNLNLL